MQGSEAVCPCSEAAGGAGGAPSWRHILLLWRAVLALPVASSIGLDWSRRVERFECSSAEARHTWQGRLG